MTSTLKIVALIPACVFTIVGLAWLIAPSFVAGHMRMALLSGDGLSTQIADLAAFFLTLGVSILMAILTNRAVWLYPAMLLLGLAALGRVIAWQFHAAALAPDMIAVEVVVVTLLFFLARGLEGRAN